MKEMAWVLAGFYLFYPPPPPPVDKKVFFTPVIDKRGVEAASWCSVLQGETQCSRAQGTLCAQERVPLHLGYVTLNTSCSRACGWLSWTCDPHCWLCFTVVLSVVHVELAALLTSHLYFFTSLSTDFSLYSATPFWSPFTSIGTFSSRYYPLCSCRGFPAVYGAEGQRTAGVWAGHEGEGSAEGADGGATSQRARGAWEGRNRQITAGAGISGKLRIGGILINLWAM